MRPLPTVAPSRETITRPRPNAPVDAATERARHALEAGAENDGLGRDGLSDDADTRARIARLLALEGRTLSATVAATSDTALAALGRHLERCDAPGSGLSCDERMDLHVHLARWLDAAGSGRWQAALPPTGATEYARSVAVHRAPANDVGTPCSALARLDQAAMRHFRPETAADIAERADADTASLRTRVRERVMADPAGLDGAARLAFGDKAGTDPGRAMIAALSAGTLPMPPVRVVEPGSLGTGVRGAYDGRDGGTILIDRSVLADPRLAEAVYVEELGHHLDAHLGGTDSLGDEGAVFARTLLDEAPAGAALAALRAENDHGHVLLDGQGVAVEFDRGMEPDVGRELPFLPEAELAEPVADPLETLRSERYDLYLRAVEGFPEPPAAGVRHALATAAADVSVALQRFRDGEIGRSAFVDVLNDANNLYRTHTGRELIGPRSRRGRLTVTYNGSNVPDHLKGHGNQDDLRRSDWRTTADLARTTDGKAKSYGTRFHEALMTRGNVRDLDYLAADGELPRAGVAVRDTLAPLAELSRSGFDPSDESSDDFRRFSEGLETVVRLQSEADPDSESDWRGVYDANFDLAALLLTGDEGALTRRDFRTAYAWITAGSLRELGYRHTFWGPDPLEPNRGNNVQQEYPGGYGNFGRAKYEFALAVLRSDKSERLRIFGIDETAWNRAEGFIAGGNQARARANAIEDARFGFDDVVKIGIGAAFVYAGVAFPGALAASTAYSASTVVAVTGASVGAGLSGFGLNFALTGDIKASVEAGAVSALTAGLAEYAAGFDGRSKAVVEALTRGVTEEITGGQFIDGVLASVVETYGPRYEALLADKTGPFVAGLTAVVVETAVRERGDLSGIDDLIEAYVRDYAQGRVQERLTDVLGEESEALAGAFAGLASRAIDSNGRLDTDAMLAYLESPAFLSTLGADAGRRVTDWFGGPDQFRAALLGDLTNLLIATGGDADRIGAGIEAIGMDMAARYASGEVMGALTEDGEEPSPLALAVGDLVRIGIGSGFDGTTMRTYAYGAVLDQLVARGGDALTASFGGTGRFMSGLLDELVRSVEANGGDLRAITQDIALYMARSPAYDGSSGGASTAGDSLVGSEEMRAVFGATLRAGGRPTAGVSGLVSRSPTIAAARPEVGDTGSDVRAVEQRLRTLGYDPRTVDTRYDRWSARATSAFAADQLVLLDRLAVAYARHSPGSREAEVVGQAHAELAAEVAAMTAAGDAEGDQEVAPVRMGRWTAALLDATLTEDTVAAIERAFVDAEPFAPVDESAPAATPTGPAYDTPTVDLPIERTLARGDEGPDVEALQRRLNALRGPGDAALVPDGDYGPNTALAVTRFQDAQLLLLGELEPDAPTDANGRTAATVRHELRAERVAGEVGATTLAALERPFESPVPRSERVPEPTEGPLLVNHAGPRVRALQERLQELGHDPRGVDGIFGTDTREALQVFQDTQLEFLDDAIDRSEGAPPHRVTDLVGIRDEILTDRAIGRTGPMTDAVLDAPLDDDAVDRFVEAALAPPSDEEVLFYLTSLEPSGGNGAAIPVAGAPGGFGLLSRFSDADKLREVMRWLDDVDGPADAREILDLMEPAHFRALGPGLDRLTAGEIESFVDDMAPYMRSTELLELFSTTSDATRVKVIQAVRERGDPALQRTFADVAQRDLVARETRVDDGFSPADRELALDLGQLALDLAGIVDPTPLSDGTNAIISLLRGDWFGATTSAVSILPWIGDMAKLGKLGKWAETVEAAVTRAATDPDFARRVRPALERIGSLIDAIPEAALNRLPDSARRRIDDMGARIDAFRAGRIGSTVTGRLGDNTVTWKLDAEGRPVHAEARLSQVHAEPRTSEETRLQREAGGSDRLDSDQGGHLIAHRFIGEDGGLANLFPQNANFNLSAYKTLENEVADWIQAGGRVRMEVDLRYGDGGTRPERVEVTYHVHHKDTGELMYERSQPFDNDPGQVFERRTTTFIAERLEEYGP